MVSGLSGEDAGDMVGVGGHVRGPQPLDVVQPVGNLGQSLGLIILYDDGFRSPRIDFIFLNNLSSVYLSCCQGSSDSNSWYERARYSGEGDI